jgi:two-component system, OmpR family, phosphate regulon sensor histidine kinase PhoR
MSFQSLRRAFSRAAFRLALPLSGIMVGVSAILIAWLTDLSLVWMIAVPLGCGALMLVLSYAIIHLYHFDRLRQLNVILRNITKKDFGEYDTRQIHRDELDSLLMQAMRASETMEREIARLNRTENYRKEFIGDMSHELKTPIFAIQGFVETLLNGAMNDPKVNKQFLGKTMKNVDRLIVLIQDLMEISKLETGEMRANMEAFSLKECLLDVVDELQVRAQKEGVEIHIQDFDKHLKVVADRGQMRQVLVNLMENGIKYNKPGGRVDVGLKPFPKRSEKILLYVKDTGIGIEQEDLNRVTERFYRVDKSRSRDKGGTGLGLSIVKHIVMAHGENLYLESEPGKGSTFSVTLARPSGVVLHSEAAEA